MNGLYSFIRLFSVLLTFFACSDMSAQRVAFRTDAVYWITTTPNMGVEARLGNHVSLGLQAGYNPFEFSSQTLSDGQVVPRKLKNWLLRPEIKYWFCKTYERNYLSLQGIAGAYNIGGLLTGNDRGYRYKGEVYGVGLNWGYQWAVSRRWGVEASVGVGYLYLPYDKYECVRCGDFLGRYALHYVGPTKLEASLVYYIN